MTEPKYVKISEELRDYLVLCGEVIQPLLNVTIEGWNPKKWNEALDQLRAAPSVEMLDLEKVERWSLDVASGGQDVWLSSEKSPDGDWVRFSDLESLTVPEQSGGVVTRDMVDQCCLADTPQTLWNALESERRQRQPVQASEAQGVELSVITEEQRNDGLDLFEKTADWSIYRDHEKREMAFNYGIDFALAHLQQAPQGVSETNVNRAFAESGLPDVPERRASFIAGFYAALPKPPKDKP